MAATNTSLGKVGSEGKIVCMCETKYLRYSVSVNTIYRTQNALFSTPPKLFLDVSFHCEQKHFFKFVRILADHAFCCCRSHKYRRTVVISGMSKLIIPFCTTEAFHSVLFCGEDTKVRNGAG